MTNPQQRKLRQHKEDVLDLAQKGDRSFQDFRIRTYHWPGGPRKILLIHGWEGQAGNFADLILQLRQQNYSIYAFDGPGHGHSSKGPTSLFAFSDLVGSLIQDVQPQLLVSHSFGGIATTYALYNNPSLKIDKYVLLTVPDRFEQRIDTVAQNVGITPKVKSLLIQQLEKETQQKVSSFNVSNFVGQINVQKALILHDKDDKVIPISRSQTVCDNWPQCKLITVEGTGHFRILRTDSVLQQVIDFLK